VNARQLWVSENPRTSTFITAYCVNGHTVIVTEFGGGNGWEIYVPATDSGKIADTFAAVESRLGITEKRELTDSEVDDLVADHVQEFEEQAASIAEGYEIEQEERYFDS